MRGGSGLIDIFFDLRSGEHFVGGGDNCDNGETEGYPYRNVLIFCIHDRGNSKSENSDGVDCGDDGVLDLLCVLELHFHIFVPRFVGVVCFFVIPSYRRTRWGTIEVPYVNLTLLKDVSFLHKHSRRKGQ